MWLTLAFFMFVVATVFSMLGQGGGVLYTPIQVWLGIDFHQAATTSLFLIVVTSLSASLVFHKAKKIDWPLAFALETVTAAGSFAGGLSSESFSGATLSIFFGVVVAVASIFMIHPMRPSLPCVERKASFFSWNRTLNEQTYCINLAIALPMSFIAGSISGMVGVGGGILKVPMMVLLFGIPMDIAVGSSAFMVGLTASGGFAGHVINGHWDWKVSLMLAIAVFVGGQFGSRFTVKLDKAKLKKSFGYFLLVIAVTMVVKALM